MNAPWLLLAMIGLTFASSSCVTTPPIDQAITIHNVFRTVLLDFDAELAPLIRDADAQAMQAANGDLKVYAAAMQPWQDAVTELATARKAEQAIHLGLQQWAATGEDGKVLRETYACAAAAVQAVSDKFGALPRGSVLYAASFAIAAQLRAQAAGAECGVKL
jgi:hypothetical protein